MKAAAGVSRAKAPLRIRNTQKCLDHVQPDTQTNWSEARMAFSFLSSLFSLLNLMAHVSLLHFPAYINSLHQKALFHQFIIQTLFWHFKTHSAHEGTTYQQCDVDLLGNRVKHPWRQHQDARVYKDTTQQIENGFWSAVHKCKASRLSWFIALHGNSPLLSVVNTNW